MAANALPILVYIDTRVFVCHRYDIQNIDVQLETDFRQLIRKGDIDIPEGVFHQFGHFSRFRIRLNDLPLNEGFINKTSFI